MKNIQAFPVPDSTFQEQEQGMTLLDYFTGKALTGYTSNQTAIEEIVALSKAGKGKVVDIVASHCYEFAKAMLKERERLNV